MDRGRIIIVHCTMAAIQIKGAASSLNSVDHGINAESAKGVVRVSKTGQLQHNYLECCVLVNCVSHYLYTTPLVYHFGLFPSWLISLFRKTPVFSHTHFPSTDIIVFVMMNT